MSEGEATATRASREVWNQDLEHRFARLERRVEWLVIALAVAVLALIAYLPFASSDGELASVSGWKLATAEVGEGTGETDGILTVEVPDNFSYGPSLIAPAAAPILLGLVTALGLFTGTNLGDRSIALLMIAMAGLFILADGYLFLAFTDAFDVNSVNPQGSAAAGLWLHAGWLVLIGGLAWKVFRASRVPDPGIPELLPEYQ